MTDYIGTSLNGVVHSPSILSPDDAYGIFFLTDGSMAIVASPLTSSPTVVTSLPSNSVIIRNKRLRVAASDVNAGLTLVAAVTGLKIRMIACTAIAIGGSAATVTTVDVLGTQSAGSVKLVAFAQASLTRSAVLKDGGTGAAVLADGASYIANDVSTGVTVGITGSSMTTATSVDFNFTYTLE